MQGCAFALRFMAEVYKLENSESLKRGKTLSHTSILYAKQKAGQDVSTQPAPYCLFTSYVLRSVL
jgi:hypothetical protein